MTDIYYDTNGYPAVGYVVPYGINGQFYGIVAFNFSLSSLYKAIKDKGMNTEGINFVLTNEGKVVLSSETTGTLAASVDSILDKKLQITTVDELQTLSNSVNNMTDELKEYMTNLAQVTAEKQHIATELSLARGIQEGMLPKIFPKITESGGIELFAVMESAKSVGGDFYDFYALDKEHIAITMADVSGKGVPAALFTEFGVNKSRALLVYDYYHSERCLSICWYKLFRILERCEGYEEKRKDIA